MTYRNAHVTSHNDYKMNRQIRQYASQASSLLPKQNQNPQTFLQRVVQSDGSSFIIRTTSPRPLLTLTKDTRNHPLWNPELVKAVDTSIHLDRFKQKFGAADFMQGDELDLGFDVVQEEVKEKVVTPPPSAQAGKKGKKK